MPKKESSNEVLEKKPRKTVTQKETPKKSKTPKKEGATLSTTKNDVSKNKKVTSPKKETKKRISKEDNKMAKKVESKTSSRSKSKNTVAKTTKKASSNVTSKATSKSSTKNKATKANKTTKAIANNKVDTKKTINKVDTKKSVNKTVDNKEKVSNKVEEKAKLEENKVNEETVIEKIKNFIAKIVAMQEEAEIEQGVKKEKKVSIKNTVKKENNQQYMIEYYDLAYRYNETIVKILAQTPKRLFVYWDVSDNDRARYTNTFGEDFFNKTYPVLLVYNEDRKYVKEVPVNDFANSWYIDIQDSKNKYIIQLGRKFKQVPNNINMMKVNEENIILRNDYLPFANSNQLEVPNDHVLLESLPRFITFRNVKTNEEFIKDIGAFKDAYGNNYSIDGFYNEQYKDEISEGMFDMANPSSKLSSSIFK